VLFSGAAPYFFTSCTPNLILQPSAAIHMGAFQINIALPKGGNNAHGFAFI
jgi:hypothetical protein